MAGDRRIGVPARSGGPAAGDEWLAPVAASAAAACRAPVELLGGYLPMLADAAINGRCERRPAGGRRTQELARRQPETRRTRRGQFGCLAR